MNRDEFIRYAAQLDRAKLQKTADVLREQSKGRIPPETEKQFRSLDDMTTAEEVFAETSFGRTHLYFVQANERTDALSPVILNIHGGGWALPHTERDIYFSRRIAARTHCLIVDIDYVLAPEYPFPAALEEIEALSFRLVDMLKERNGDPERVILCGQSAGGNLAAALCQRKRMSDDLHVKGQILCYFPADNYRNRFGEDTALSPRDEATEYYGFFYNTEFKERKNPDVSLVYADAEVLAGLPKTSVMTAGMDNLMPEAKTYYEMLVNAGVQASYRCFEHSRHGFLVNLYDEWQEGEDHVVSEIERMLK